MKAWNNTLAVAARFSAAAGTYHQAAAVQRTVAESLERWLPELPPAAAILEIGCGTGVLTAILRRRYPGAWIDLVDISARMMAQVRTRLGFDHRVRCRVADVRQLPAKPRYPLIVSSSSLHWIQPLEEGLNKVAALLEPGGQAVFSLMTHGTLGELRQCRLRVAPDKPPAGSLPTLRQVRQGLRQAGLKVVEQRKEIQRIKYSSAAAFLRQIHDQGLTGGNVSSANLPLNRRELKKIIMDYQAAYPAGAGVLASYHVAYFLARKDGGE